MALELLYKRFIDAAAASYKRAAAVELNKLGVRYEDLIIEEPYVVEAVKLADPDVQHGRLRRLKRASDLSFKGKILQDYAPNMQLEPFKEEIYEDILKIRRRDQEYDALNYHKK